jgi:serine/threonine protein kinase
VRQNLLREIKILSRLGSQTHILRMYESIDTFNSVYVVTECLDEGRPLNEVIQSRGRLTENDAL